MPPPCMHCDSQCVINLETARKLGTAAGALFGSMKGVYSSLYAPGVLIAVSTRFPMSRIASAVVAATSGGIAGAATGHQMVQHFFPPGEGTPWLCLGCGHAFRFMN